jgi:D-serine deaminase-like pyridoxal phosphate-dependent protein
VAVDSARNVDDLSEAATASGVTLRPLVEVDAGLGRCGVPPGRPAVELAQHAARSPGLSFAGLMALPPSPLLQRGDLVALKEEGGGLFPDRAALESETRRHIQPVLDTRELIERDGLPVPAVSVGGTHNYDIAGRMSGVTEVQAGSYPLMDYNYCQVRSEFTQAAKVLAQVISHPVDHRAVLDAGHKATGPDRGVPVLEGFPGARAIRFSAEHGILELEEAAFRQLMPGDKAWLLPFHLGLCLNQYDYLRAIRGGKLVGFWPLAGRGRFG